MPATLDRYGETGMIGSVSGERTGASGANSGPLKPFVPSMLLFWRLWQAVIPGGRRWSLQSREVIGLGYSSSPL